jgi:uracil-DNA glycosylase family 4
MSTVVVTVSNQGNRTARLFILGEAPGAEEEREGKPFVGKAGRLLFELLSGVGVSRDDVFMANVVRFRPTTLSAAGKRTDRKPTKQEIEADGRAFAQDLETLRPAVVLALGETAATALGVDIGLGMTRLRGQLTHVGGNAIMPSFHPAYILRDPSKKALFVEDLQACVGLLRDEGTRRSLVRSA